MPVDKTKPNALDCYRLETKSSVLATTRIVGSRRKGNLRSKFQARVGPEGALETIVEVECYEPTKEGLLEIRVMVGGKEIYDWIGTLTHDPYVRPKPGDR